MDADRLPTIEERARRTPVAEDVDVLVCGGGPAGVAAAVASARAGARTGLVEAQGCLGGIWTSGCLCSAIDCENKGGLMLEILTRIERMGGRTIVEGRPTKYCDIERMKVFLDALCSEAGVRVRLHDRVVGAAVSGGRITHVLTESKSGRQALAAKVCIDGTGDGDLGAFAGCGYDVGNPETRLTQPMSLIAMVAGIDPKEVKPFFRYGNEVPWAEPKTRLREEMEKAGVSPSYAMPTLTWIHDDVFALMANHEYGVLGTDAGDVTRATIRARREIHALVDGLRSLGGVWRGLRIVSTGSHIGVREGRRIHGRCTVVADDMLRGARHADAVCRVTFGMDVHATDPGKCKAIEKPPHRTQPYDIPLGALIAKDVSGLMMAGRCISGDFLAHSSYRVAGNAVALGEAAGKVAARAALTGRLPHEIAWTEVAQAEPPRG